MKKLFVLMCSLLFITGAAQAQLHTVECIGTESGGAGGTLQCSVPHSYTYLITPGAGGVSWIEIATCDSVLSNYTNICMPSGWTLQIIQLSSYKHSAKTAHGTIAPLDGGWCPAYMHFYGPYQTVPFELGFDHDAPSHNVEWVATFTGADDSEPVGMGLGPIHAPAYSPSSSSIPTLSHYGMIAVVMLLLAAGTVFIVRRRRTEA
jgi:hypothetical protein